MFQWMRHGVFLMNMWENHGQSTEEYNQEYWDISEV